MVLAALTISPSLLLAQEVSSAQWRGCMAAEDSLARLTCFDGLARGVSSAEWSACAGTEDSLARLACYDNLAQEMSSAERRACARTADSLARLSCYDDLVVEEPSAEWSACAAVEDSLVARLSCYDNLAQEVSSAAWRACAGTGDSLARLSCYDNLAQEVSSAESRACSGTADSLARLSCYDLHADRAGEAEASVPVEPPAARAQQPAARAPQPAASAQPPAEGGWQLTSEASSTSARTTWIATLSPDKEQSSLRSTAVLALRCKDGELEIFAGVNERFGDNSAITIRFDGDEPQTQSWRTATNFLFAREAHLLGFLRALQPARRLSIQVTPDHGDLRTAVFHLDPEETKRVLDSIRGDCPTVGRGNRSARW